MNTATSDSAAFGTEPTPAIRSPSPAASRDRVPTRIVAATVAGNAMEFYDFTTYAFFAVYIGKCFFPATTPLMSLLLSVAVFGVGFVTRPVGGIVIGAFADRVGRKPAMLLTIALITVGTLGLALTPSFDSIGLAAPVIVVVCRLIQGLALGGEVGPSTAFLLEVAPQDRRGFYGSWQLASQGLAALVAGVVGVVLTLLLTPADMQAWGWRVPFVFGVLLIPIAVYLRRRMPETRVPQKSSTSEAAQRSGHRRYAPLILLTILVVMGGTVSNYVANYMTTYAITTLKLAPVIGMTATIAFGLSTLVCSLIGGRLSDRYGRKRVMLLPRVALVLLTYPAFAFLVNHTSFFNLLCVTTLLSGLTAASAATSLVAIPELFPERVRALAMSISYGVSVAVFGGTTQFFITWLIGATGNPASPAIYVAFISAITAMAILLLPETAHQELKT